MNLGGLHRDVGALAKLAFVQNFRQKAANRMKRSLSTTHVERDELNEKTAPAVERETGEDNLIRAVGRAIQGRRRDLKLKSGDLPQKLGLSASYYRSIEAGTVPAPASIAVALALALRWNVTRTAELLCALHYLSAAAEGGRMTRRRELFDLGITAQVLDATGSDEEVAVLVRQAVEADGGNLTDQAPLHIDTPQGTKGPSLPWMFELSIRQMTSEISLLPFYVDRAYLETFLKDYANRIRKVAGYVSYLPTRSLFENSEYNFSFFVGDGQPQFTLAFHDPSNSAAIIKDDLVKAIAALTANLPHTGNLQSRIAEATKRLNVIGQQKSQTIRYDPKRRDLDFSGRSTTFTKEFNNAWLYEIEGGNAEGCWVGFLDNYHPETAKENFDVIALSLQNARDVHGRIFS